jgi:hypothetical protein
MPDVRLERFSKIVKNAIGSLSKRRRSSTKLYLDTHAYRGGAAVGPPVQKIKIETKADCLVVFVDDEPRANFSHACRYRFYDARSQRFIYETRAKFPPYVNYVPRTYLEVPIPGHNGRATHDERNH